MEQAIIERDSKVKRPVHTHSILLVDDSPVNLGLVVDNLEMQGYEVLVAQDGEEAMERARITSPDLILLDVMMPGLDGFEVCRRLKADKLTSGIPVIFMTSMSRLEDKMEGFAAGAVDYVTKPLQMDELRVRLSVHLKLRDLQRQVEIKNRELELKVEQRKQMEKLIKQERNMLRTFLAAMPALAWMKDRDGHYQLCNPQLEKLFGMPEAHIVGKTDFDFMKEEEACACVNSDQIALESAEPNRSEEWMMLDGQPALLEIMKAPVINAHGEVDGIIGIAHDITERKRMEQALAAREREFRTLTENSPDTIMRFDHDGRFVYVNRRFKELLGFALVDVQGKQPMQVAGLKGAEIFQQRILEVIATGRVDEFEHQLELADGQTKWVWASIFPERDTNGKTGFVQVLARNINEIKQAEKYLEESRAQLRVLLEYQEETHEQERKQISWEMHEDLLQILSVMSMYASMLHTNPSVMTENLSQVLQSLKSGLGKSIQMIREIVAALRPVALNLGLAAGLEWLVQEFIQRPGMECQLEIHESASRMDDKSSLLVFRVVQEALAFVVKSRSAASVKISLECKENGYLLTLRDHGKMNGADNSSQDFLRLLSLQERALAMGGEMVVFSAPDHGLIVETQLPFKHKEIYADQGC